MKLDFFQYQVGMRWYRVYWSIMVVFTAALGVIMAAGKFIPFVHPYAVHLGAEQGLTIVLAALTLVYLLSAYWWIARSNVPFATLVGAMLFTLLLLDGLTVSDPVRLVLIYVVGWDIIVFFSGIFELPILIGSLFLTYTFVALHANFQLSAISMPAWLLVGGSTVIAGLSYFFWKGRFVSTEAQQVSQLSGMLQSDRERSETLIQSITDGIIAINTEGKISLMNPAAATMTEWAVNEALGVDAVLVAKLSHEDGSDVTKEEDPFSLVLSEKKHIVQTYTLNGREGKKQVISLSISPIVLVPQEPPRGAIAVMRDVSEERAAEKQRAEFISTASHEMRTPVAAIEGYLALALNDKVSTVDSRARNYLEKAHSSTEHLGKLFQDLLTSSKAEDGRLSNHPSVVEMGAFTQQLTDDLKFAAEKKGLLAEFVIGGADETIDATTKDAESQHLVKPFYYVLIDPDRMREVVTNLFDNACKYTDSGKISIGLTGDAQVVQLYIRDTGSGIPADDIPHLFQKFYRVDNSATRTIGGTGLGLFICRKIVELYHGRIWVESEVGKGSTFFINLPRLSAQRATELQQAGDVAATPPAAAAAPATNPATPTAS